MIDFSKIFGILTVKPIKLPGQFWGAGNSLPLGEPRNF